MNVTHLNTRDGTGCIASDSDLAAVIFIIAHLAQDDSLPASRERFKPQCFGYVF